MATVFISYSRKDIEFAKRLTSELQKSEMDFWIDWEGIPPTVDWRKEIEKGIEEADIFLFLVSPDSAKSKICGWEIDVAVKNGKRIIPIVVREIEWEDTPPQIGHLNYIFFSRDDSFDTAVKKLIGAIHTDYGWVQAHRQLQVKALEWEKTNRESSFLLRGKELQDAEFQLATNTSKDPHPTDLQREYVFDSRKATEQQVRRTRRISIVVGIVLLALSIFSVIQARSAVRSQATAEANLVVAQTAQVDAINKQALADANAATAIANEQEAERQANIALARQLAAQAQSLSRSGTDNQEPAILLAIQSARIYPVIDSAEILQNNILALPVARLAHEDAVVSFAFSPDGEYVVSGSSDATARVWEVATGTEVAQTRHNAGVRSVAFNYDGTYVLSRSEDGLVRVWEAATGKEITSMTLGNEVTSSVFSPQGTYVISLDTVTIRIWDVISGDEIALMMHDGPVTSFKVSQDEKYLISTSEDGSARVWELPTGNEIARMTHDGPATSLAISEDEQYVASSSTDGTARVWELLTGNEIARMIADGNVTSVSFSPDGNYVSAGDSYYAIVWETTTGNEVAKTYYNDYNVIFNNFSPNGNYVLSQSSDDTARVWETATGVASAYIFNNGGVNSVAFSPDGKFVVAGGCAESIDFTCEKGSVRILESATGRDVAYMPHQFEVIDAAFSPNGKYVISVSVDGTAQIWNAQLKKEVASLSVAESMTSYAFSPNGQYMVSGNSDGTARVWETLTGTEIAQIQHEWSVTSVAFSPDGNFVISTGHDGTILSWETLTGNEIARMTHSGPVSSIAFSSDGKLVATGGCGEMMDFGYTSCTGEVRVFESSTGQEVADLPHEFKVNEVSFTADEKHMISISRDNTSTIILVWEIETKKIVSSMVLENDLVTSFALSPDGRYVVSAGIDRTASIVELTTENEIAQMNLDGWVSFFDFSRDGRYVVAGVEDGSARVWETATGKEVAQMTHGNSVSAVAISPDGKYVVSTACDTYDYATLADCQKSAIVVWETATMTEIARLDFDSTVYDVDISADGKYVAVGGGGSLNAYAPGELLIMEAVTGMEILRIPHELHASSVAFSLDGRYVVSSSYDPNAFYALKRIWLWRPKDMIARACLRVTRNLTRAEWQQYVGDALPYEAVCPNLPIEPESEATP